MLMLEIETEIAVAQEEKKLAQDTHLQLCEMHNSTLTCDFMSKLKKKKLIIDPILDQKT